MPAAAPAPSPLHLASPEATAALAARLAPHLRGGDTLLLEGPIGAGKTHFARHLIGALQRAAGAPAEEVPSPSYTLVQTYRAGPLEIWHADLYRLASADEALELGLDEAFGTALCLVEWPDRLGPAAPAEALTLRFDAGAAGAAGAAGDDAAGRWLSALPSGPRAAALAAVLAGADAAA